MENFKICVIYEAFQKGAREEFVNELVSSGNLALVRGEKGCIKYDYYYSADDPCKLVLFEEWESKSCQELHMTQPHMKAIMDTKNKYIKSATIKQITIK